MISRLFSFFRQHSDFNKYSMHLNRIGECPYNIGVHLTLHRVFHGSVDSDGQDKRVTIDIPAGGHFGMYKIVRKKVLNSQVKLLEIEAPYLSLIHISEPT